MPKHIARTNIRDFKTKFHFLLGYRFFRNEFVTKQLTQGQIAKEIGLSTTQMSEDLNQNSQSGSHNFSVRADTSEALCDIFGMERDWRVWHHDSAAAFEKAYSKLYPKGAKDTSTPLSKQLLTDKLQDARSKIKEFLLGCTLHWGSHRFGDNLKTLNTIEAVLALSHLEVTSLERDNYVVPALERLVQDALSGLLSKTISVETVQCAALFVLTANRWSSLVPGSSADLKSAADLVIGRLVASMNSIGWGTTTKGPPKNEMVRNTTSLWAYSAILASKNKSHIDQIRRPFFQFMNHLASTGYGFQAEMDSTATVQALLLIVGRQAESHGLQLPQKIVFEGIINALTHYENDFTCEIEAYISTDVAETIERLPFSHLTPLLALDALVQQRHRLSSSQRVLVLGWVSEVVDEFLVAEGRLVPVRGLDQKKANPLTYPFCYLAILLSHLEEERWLVP